MVMRAKIKVRMKPVMMAKSNSTLRVPRKKIRWMMVPTREIVATTVRMMQVTMRWPKRMTAKWMKLALREKAIKFKTMRITTLRRSPLKTVGPPTRATTWTMARMRETMSKRPMKVSPPAKVT